MLLDKTFYHVRSSVLYTFTSELLTHRPSNPSNILKFVVDTQRYLIQDRSRTHGYNDP